MLFRSRAALSPGESIAVFGAGGIGSFIVAAAAHSQPTQLIAVDAGAGRLDRAASLGATATLDAGDAAVSAAILERTSGVGADVVIESSGTVLGLAQAMASVRPGGRLVLVGIQARPAEIDLARMVVRETDLLTSNGHVGACDMRSALDLLATTELAQRVLGPSTTLHQFVVDGLEPMAAGQLSGKVVVEMRERT